MRRVPADAGRAHTRTLTQRPARVRDPPVRCTADFGGRPLDQWSTSRQPFALDARGLRTRGRYSGDAAMRSLGERERPIANGLGGIIAARQGPALIVRLDLTAECSINDKHNPALLFKFLTIGG